MNLKNAQCQSSMLKSFHCFDNKDNKDLGEGTTKGPKINNPRLKGPIFIMNPLCLYRDSKSLFSPNMFRDHSFTNSMKNDPQNHFLRSSFGLSMCHPSWAWNFHARAYESCNLEVLA
jgi:hypothetical protein